MTTLNEIKERQVLYCTIAEANRWVEDLAHQLERQEKIKPKHIIHAVWENDLLPYFLKKRRAIDWDFASFGRAGGAAKCGNKVYTFRVGNRILRMDNYLAAHFAKYPKACYKGETKTILTNLLLHTFPTIREMEKEGMISNYSVWIGTLFPKN